MPAPAATPASPTPQSCTVAVPHAPRGEELVTEIIVFPAPGPDDVDAEDIIVAGGEREVIAADVLEEIPITAEPLELMIQRERTLALEGEIARLQRLCGALDERIIELNERVHTEERRSDTWQELALRGEERVRESTLELERFRGFAHSPWWVRLRGFRRPT